MAKIIDITEKLNFDENPRIKIKSVEIEVNADASTVLKIMQASGKPEKESIPEMYELLFSEADRKKIDKLKLKFKDFTALIEVAMDSVIGINDTVGE